MQFAQNLLLLMAENAEFSSGSCDYKDKMVQKSLFKNSNKTRSYLISNAKKTFN